MLYLGCGLLVAAFAAIVRWRDWRVAVAASLAGVVGVVCIVRTARESPPAYTDDDAGALCTELSWQLDDQAFYIVFSKPTAPRRVPEHLLTRFDLAKEMFHAVAPYCTQTPTECGQILAAADPTTAEFHWQVNYVAWMMRRHEACVIPTPPPPADYPWGPRR